jgi:SAM-dependent methyltransferase
VLGTGRSCPACRSSALEPFFTVSGVAALSNALAPSRALARAAPTGTVSLAMCQTCTLLVNTAFDPALVEYAPGYENSLHHSPAFQAYAEEVAERLVEGYDVRGGTVLEIGPGQGDFLALLSKLGDNDAVGYEPSYDPLRRPNDLPARVRIEPVDFPVDANLDVDLVAVRHVLEHIPDPAPLLTAARRSVARSGGVVYVEVPDGDYLLDEIALWDVIYEHCLHFTAPALQALVTGSGFEVRDLGSSFGGQFLWTELSAGFGGRVDLPGVEVVEARRRAAGSFASRSEELLQRADVRVGELVAEGPVALWGVGSKGTTFLSMVPSAAGIAGVVDVNPYKQGRFVPVTGQEVLGPDALVELAPRAVVVLNRNYIDEVNGDLRRLGVEAPVVTI